MPVSGTTMGGEQHTVEPDHNHESHFSWFHENTMLCCTMLAVALIGLLAAWWKRPWRKHD